MAKVKLNLGCGPHRLPGWMNLDLDYGHDLRKGLPLADGGAEEVWSEHFIEHIEKRELIQLLQECKRVLAPGGRITLSTPDAAYLCEAALGHRLEAYCVNGQGAFKPQTRSDLLNEGMRSWGHLYLWFEDDLARVMSRAGFVSIERIAPPPYAVRPYLGDLVLSAIRGNP